MFRILLIGFYMILAGFYPAAVMANADTVSLADEIDRIDANVIFMRHALAPDMVIPSSLMSIVVTLNAIWTKPDVNKRNLSDSILSMKILSLQIFYLANGAVVKTRPLNWDWVNGTVLLV